MFGWTELGRLETDVLFCAAESGDGNVYVGAMGAKPRPYLWPQTEAEIRARPGLYTLKNGAFTAVEGFETDTWVEGLRADGMGVWACGGRWGYQGYVWRIEAGEIMEELHWEDRLLLSDVIEVEGGVHTGASDYLAELREQVYRGHSMWGAGWYAPVSENPIAAFQGRIWGIVASATLPARQALAWWDGRQWHPVATWEPDGIWYNRIARVRGRLWMFGHGGEVPGDDEATWPYSTQGYYGWFDGRNVVLGKALPWIPVRITDSGLKPLPQRLVVTAADTLRVRAGNKCMMGTGDIMGEDLPGHQAHAVMLLSADLAIHELRIGVSGGGGVGPSLQEARIGLSGGAGDGPSVQELRIEVSAGVAPIDEGDILAIHELRVGMSAKPGESGDSPALHEVIVGLSAPPRWTWGPSIQEVEIGLAGGGGETPSIQEVRVGLSGGEGEAPSLQELRIGVSGEPSWLGAPSLQEVRVELSGTAGVETGERVRWLRSIGTEPCYGLLITTDLPPATQAQIRAIVRADKEHLAVDDWGSYQAVPLNTKVYLDEPGLDVRIGIVRPAGVAEAADLGVQLLRE